MKLYCKEKYYTLYEGKMQEVLSSMPDNSVDAIITDPPYEISFMGKGWDATGVAYTKETWEHCFRVLKSGGYLLSFGATRTFHRIAVAIEDAGFEIRDTIMWLYGSGFPKSMDISKQIDKKGGNDYSKQFAKDLKQARESRSLTMKYCDDKYCNGSTNWSWYEGRKDGCRVPDYRTYLEIIKDFPELGKYRELIKEAEREVIGTITRTKGVAIPACGKNLDRKSYDYKLTTASTELAKQWQGWGTCLKPAYEPIIVARKPFKGSLVDNVIEYGVGGLNIDECRVENTNADNYDLEKRQVSKATGSENDGHFLDKLHNQDAKHGVTNLGRFPANVILTYDETDFDEVCGDMPTSDRPNGNITKNYKINNQIYGDYGYRNTFNAYQDSGSASRYFYCAKASKKDRDEGLDKFEEKQKPEYCLQYHNGVKRNEMITRKNIHPTVKPVELMQYLVRLVTPKKWRSS